MNLVTCCDFTLTSANQPLMPLFEPLTFKVEAGGILGIIGVNGVGKSLLLRTISTGSAPQRFRIRGEIVTLEQRASKQIFYLPQLQAPDVHMPFLLWEVAALEGGVQQKYPWFDHNVASKSWNNASGGERMRALLARAFTSNAQLLLLDEPFNHLDSHSAANVRAQMRTYVEAKNDRAIVFVSHAEGASNRDDQSNPLHFPILEVTPPSHQRKSAQ